MGERCVSDVAPGSFFNKKSSLSANDSERVPLTDRLVNLVTLAEQVSEYSKSLEFRVFPRIGADAPPSTDKPARDTHISYSMASLEGILEATLSRLQRVASAL